MSDLVQFLLTPLGSELVHAVILLITAIAAYIAYLSRRAAKENAKLLDGHLEQHRIDAALREESH